MRLNFFHYCFTIVVLAISPFLANSQATLLWAEKLGGSNYDYPTSLSVDAFGKVYTVGYFNGSADFDPSAGSQTLTSSGQSDIFISKLGPTGNFIWVRRVGGVDADDASAIASDSLGNIYFTGSFGGTVDFDPGSGTYNLTSIGASDFYISKLDSAGNFVWAVNLGGAGIEQSKEIALKNNQVLVSGYFQGTIDLNPGSGASNFTASGNSGFVVSLDTSSSFNWAKTFSEATIGNASCDAIFMDQSSNIYITGNFQGTIDFDPNAGTSNLTAQGSQDVFVVKLDSTGNFSYSYSIGGIGSSAFGYSIATDDLGNAYVTGSFTNTADFDGSLGVSNITSTGGFDLFIVKLNSVGLTSWVKTIGGTGNEKSNGLAIDASGYVYTTGFFNGTVDFDPSSGVLNLTASGGGTAYINKLDSMGNFVWAGKFGGAVSNGLAVYADNLSGVYACGYFGVAGDFDPEGGVFTLSPSGASDVYVLKLTNIFMGLLDNFYLSNTPKIFPNPSTGIFFIELNKIENVFIEVNSWDGKLIFSFYSNSPISVIDLTNKPKGIYFISLTYTSNNKKSLMKIINQ